MSDPITMITIFVVVFFCICMGPLSSPSLFTVATTIAENDAPILLTSFRNRFSSRQALINSHDFSIDYKSTERGYVTCACGKLMSDLLRTIYFLRVQWKSHLPISVMHCNELTADHIALIQAMDEFGNITPTNMCTSNKVVGMEGSYGHNRLRGFFCKPAALILSPYNNTMLIDLDLVWLRSPDLLFDSSIFAKTGALFFRDRILHAKTSTDPSGAPNNRIQDWTKVLEQYKITLNDSYVQQQYYAHGITPWWRCLLAYWPKETHLEHCYGETQDSSMVLVNKKRHPRMLQVLQELIPNFDVGYGDKEIYWIAATIAGEDFTFTPFAAGQYGDCSGQILHYFPDDIQLIDHLQHQKSKKSNHPHNNDSSSLINAELHRLKPFYINAEYTVEQGDRLNAVGNYLQRKFTVAQLFHDPRTMSNITTQLLPHNYCYFRPHFASNCTCRDHACLPLPSWLVQQLYYHQWVSFSLTMSRDQSLSDHYAQNKRPYCIPILMTAMPMLNLIFHQSAATFAYMEYMHMYLHHPHLASLSEGSSSFLHHRHQKDKLNNNKNNNHNNSRVLSGHSHSKTHMDSSLYMSSSIHVNHHGFDKRNCAIIGCPSLPILILNDSFRNELDWNPGFGRLCEPVSFTVPIETIANKVHQRDDGIDQQEMWNQFDITAIAADILSGNHSRIKFADATYSTMDVPLPAKSIAYTSISDIIHEHEHDHDHSADKVHGNKDHSAGIAAVYNASYTWHNHHPIAAYDGFSLFQLAQQWRQPKMTINTPFYKHQKQLITCPGSRAVYQLSEEQKVFRKIASWASFLKMGLDGGDVMSFKQTDCGMVKFGEDLPEA